MNVQMANLAARSCCGSKGTGMMKNTPAVEEELLPRTARPKYDDEASFAGNRKGARLSVQA